MNSDPVDPAEAPLLIAFEPRAGETSDWRIVWQAFTNRNATYSILSTTNPVNGFTVFTNLTAAPPVMTSPPLPAAHRYFGLRMP